MRIPTPFASCEGLLLLPLNLHRQNNYRKSDLRPSRPPLNLALLPPACQAGAVKSVALSKAQSEDWAKNLPFATFAAMKASNP